MLSFCIFIVILVDLNIVTSEGVLNDLILPETQDKCSNDIVTNCIVQTAIRHIPGNSLIFVVSSGKYPDNLLRSISQHSCFVYITRSFKKRNWLTLSEAYFIVANNITDFLIGIEQLSDDLSWNPAAKFVILFNDIEYNEIAEVFKKLLHKDIYNVVLFVNSKDDAFEVFTYYPYSGNNCGNNANDIRSFGYCPNFTETDFYPDKMPNGLRNCTFVVAAKEDIPFIMFNNSQYSKYLESGIEQFVLNTIAEYEGFNLEYIYIDSKKDFGIILPNKTGTGLVGYLQRKEVNIIAGGLFIMRNRLEVFDYISGYSYIKYSIFTPVLPEQKWVRVYRQFSGYTWLLIILSFITIVIVILVLDAVVLKKTTDKFMLILKLWKYFYGQSDLRLFNDRYLRRILVVWIFYTSFIYAFYNTALYSLITRHVQDQITIDPNNPANLPLKPCISDVTRTYFLYTYNEVYPEGDNDPKCQNVSTIFESVASRTDLYTIETDYAYYLRATTYAPKMNKWDYPRSIVVTMYVPKGFPLKHKFEDYAYKIYENGLIQRLISSLYSKQPKAIPTMKRKYSEISLADFKMHFLTLFIGITISFVCFLLELNSPPES